MSLGGLPTAPVAKDGLSHSKTTTYRMAFLLGGGLEPRFRVLLSAIFHGVSLGNCHQGRKWRILAEAKLLQTAASQRTFYL